MARGRSSAPSRSAPARAPAPAPARAAPPPAVQHAPPPAVHHAPPPMMAPPQQQSGGMLSGIGSTIVQGMAFGTGSAIAHRAVDSVVGAFSGSKESAPAPTRAPEQAPQVRAPQGPCALDNAAFLQCLQQNSNNAGACDSYYNALQQCQMANGGGY